MIGYLEHCDEKGKEAEYHLLFTSVACHFWTSTNLKPGISMPWEMEDEKFRKMWNHRDNFINEPLILIFLDLQFFLRFFFLISLLEYNCFTMLC